MLDIDTSTGLLLTDIESVLKQAITQELQTPFEGRIFNPEKGTSASSMLQETVHSLVFERKIGSILTSAIERAIPDVNVTIKITPVSNGDGTSDLNIHIEVDYLNNLYYLVFSTDRIGFIN